MVKLSHGDRVLGKDGQNTVVEMMVEETRLNERGELTVTCVWPVYENGDPPLYRRAFERSEVEPVGRAYPVEPVAIEPPATPSRRPPEPEDMRVLVGLVTPPGTRPPLVYMTREEAREYFGGDPMTWPLGWIQGNGAPNPDRDLKPANVPQISPEALELMENGWTPAQVRALIADYRKLAGYE